MPNSFAKYLPASLQDGSEKLAFLSLAGCVSLVLVSIAASQILLALTAIGYVWMLRRHKEGPLPGMQIILPLLAFALWTVIAALASSNVWLGLTITKKFYLFLLVFLVPAIVRGEGRLTWIYKAIFAVAVFSSLVGIVQFAANPHRDLLHRITGFTGQWMTYSGLLMLALILLAVYALCNGLIHHKWVMPAFALICLALIISQTRNAWMGTVAGIMSALIFMRRPRAIALLLLAMIGLYFAAPQSIKQRFLSGMNPADPNTRNRIELFETSIRLIRDNPWLGVGPKNVKYEALRYRGRNEYPDWMYQHMHNNVLQIAAETGIPGLILWLWFMVRLAWDAARCFRHANARSPSAGAEANREALMASAAALAGWIAIMIAGVAEYNFGDSEVLTLFLFVSCAPYAYLYKWSAASGSELLHSNP
jgi:putative inorganic carbon (HCO3(-)) transporter